MTPKNKLFELQSLLESASVDIGGLLYITSDLVPPLLAITQAQLLITKILLEEANKEPKSSQVDLSDI